MSGLKRFFNKSRKPTHQIEESPSEPYRSVNSESLERMPPAELLSIIYRYDSEVKYLNTQLEESSQKETKAKSQMIKLKEELVLHRGHGDKLNEEFHAVSVDLKKTAELCEQQKIKVTMMTTELETKDELLRNFKQQIRDLAENSTESGSTGTEGLRAKVAKLKKKLYQNNPESLQELEIAKKLLENEVTKQSALCRQQESQIQSLTTAMATLETERKKLYSDIQHNKHSNSTTLEELSKLKFQKESMSTELKSLCDRLARKDAKTADLRSRLAGLENDVKSKTEENFSLKSEYEEKIYTLQKSENSSFSNQFAALSHRIQELESQLNTQTKENSELTVKLETQAQEHSALKTSFSCEQEKNIELSKQLEDLKNKRKQAKAELIRLSQRQTQQPVSEFRINPLQVPQGEIRPLQALQRELESIYKSLMNMMFTATSTKSVLQIPNEVFSLFEQRLNNVLMQVHEALDMSRDPSWSSKLATTMGSLNSNSGRLPVKLFSCMRSEEETSSVLRPKTMLGKKLVSSTGGARRIDEQEISEQRRTSQAYGKLI